MPEHIDYEAKTDRELLLLNTMVTNACLKQLKELNGTVRDHEHRLTIIETSDKIRAKVSECLSQEGKFTIPFRDWVKIGSIGFAIGGFILGAIYCIGKLVGVWG